MYNIRETKIKKILEALEDYWLARPYLRLGQITSNAFTIHPTYRRNPEPDIQDVFYMPDDHFLESLELLSKNEPKVKRTT